MSISSEVIISTLKRMWKLLAAKTTKRNSDLGEGLFLSFSFSVPSTVAKQPPLLEKRPTFSEKQLALIQHGKNVQKLQGKKFFPCYTVICSLFIWFYFFYYFEGRLKLDSFFVHCLDRQGTFTNFRDGFWRFVILYLWRK